MSVHRIEGRIRTYAWGSRTALAELTGRPVPTAPPPAALWFGGPP
ncbi:MAG: mannose-6-phosphate isomerase, class I, partial [Corynebacterium sp.]|nr:mannose-6-phosphate isomerase, class I [Corynebacterium sp.]